MTGPLRHRGPANMAEKKKRKKKMTCMNFPVCMIALGNKTLAHIFL